ncbi:MAG: endonuclease MutS2 [Clostridia bacterium]
MLQKYLDKLEYNKILEQIANYCCTYIGKENVLELLPSNSKEIVQLQLNQTVSALNLLYRKGEPSINDIANIELWIKNLESYNSLSAKALLEVAKVLQTARELHEYFFEDTNFDLSEFSTLEDLFSMLYSNKTIEDNIFNSIIDENTISDDASKALSSLRRNRKKLEQDIRDKLSNFIHSSYSKYLMDSIITIRNDRFVIPVKEEYKDQISGAILDMSASGSTVYIEPSAIFELNNKINGIKAEEAIEIEKILKNLSLSLFPIASKLKINLETIGKIDFIFAKAKYSKKVNGICPIINTEKQVFLYGARHPLIDEKSVVPIDISIGKDYTSLLITGPNTGGKTVTLKTVGLLCLMTCSGILIPANENSSIYVFDNIFADIGDEQSIQESLSTFSSHIINIINILKDATSNSLILIDELGSGTDPLEGSSLAISILEHFYEIGALTICTTHYPELKKYALTHSGFENASSDFDVENLKPTYKLLIGVPGKSNAFAISKKLGLSEEIIDRAQSFIKQDDKNIETLLKNIYDDKLAIELEKEKMQKNSNQIEILRKSLERDNSKLNKEAENIISNAKLKARDILLDAKEEANEIIKELNEETTNIKTANKLRNNLNDSINKLSKENITSNDYKALTSEEIFVGQNVFYKKLNLEGAILSLPNKSNEVKVQLGSISMNVNIKDLCGTSNSNYSNTKSGSSSSKSSNLCNIKSNKNSVSGVSFSNQKSKNISSEINVIGLNVDQALPIVDKYLDDCYMAHLEQARIVHGKGTGKLREGIHNFLKTHPHIKSFRLGTFGEGEAGVTVVSFK